MKKVILLTLSHFIVGFVGFAAGIYTLPILTAPPAPTDSELAAMQTDVLFTGEFTRNLADSDTLHWGEGQLSVSADKISLQGEIAPGPDYILYLSPAFIETEADFNAYKSSMVAVGDIKTFNNFIVSVPSDIDVSQYDTAIVWCESFGEFITSAQYR